MKYYIFVEGGYAPKQEHETLEDAEKECVRLASMPNTLNKKIYIFQGVKVFKNIPTLVNITEEISSAK